MGKLLGNIGEKVGDNAQVRDVRLDLPEDAGNDLLAAVGRPAGDFGDFGIGKVVPDPHNENFFLIRGKVVEVFHDFRKLDLMVDVLAEIGSHGSGFDGFVEFVGNRFGTEVIDRSVIRYREQPGTEFRLGIPVERLDLFQGLEKGFLRQVFREGLVKRLEIEKIVNLFDVGLVEVPERFEVSFPESPYILVGHLCRGLGNNSWSFRRV
jgi:hypothetical protein